MADNSDVKRRYARIVDALPAVHPDGAGERRKAPRIPVTSASFTAAFTDVGVKTVAEVQAKDISMSGVCFFSDQPFPAGAEIELSIAKVFSLSAIVVSCDMEETDATFLEVRYRVRCRFENEKQGMELLVLAKEAEMASQETTDP